MDFDAVVTYFKAHFTQVHRRNNENKRVLYTHLTSVVVSFCRLLFHGPILFSQT